MAQHTAAGIDDGPATPAIDWDDSNMQSSYANVCNVNGSREEVVLFFGISSPAQAGGEPQVQVKLSDRIILSPYAAKRLSLLLNAAVGTYEDRFGSLSLEPLRANGAAPSKKN